MPCGEFKSSRQRLLVTSLSPEGTNGDHSDQRESLLDTCTARKNIQYSMDYGKKNSGKMLILLKVYELNYNCWVIIGIVI